MGEPMSQTNWRGLGERMAAPMSDEQVSAVKHHLRTRRKREIRRRLLLGGSAMLSVVCAAVLYVVDARLSTPREPVLKGENSPNSETRGPERVAVALETGTRYTLEEGVARRVYRVTAGKVRFETDPRDEKALEVRVGVLVIEDVGTVFTVEALPAERALVSVEDGRVRVTWPEGAVVLAAGERGSFPPTETRQEGSEKPDAVEVRKRSAAPDWRIAARKGQYEKALALLESDADGVPNRVADLLLAADVMRLGGKPEQAARYLTRVMTYHGKDPRADLAAFTLGRVYLDELGRPRQAAEAFHRAGRAKSPLAEEATAREVEAWSRAGDTTRAEQAALRYLARYPDGDRVDAVRAFGGLNER